MPVNQTEIDTFNESLKATLPRLRVYALSLTHNRDRAENLVQQASLNALVGRESFVQARTSGPGYSASSAMSSSRNCGANSGSRRPSTRILCWPRRRHRKTA